MRTPKKESKKKAAKGKIEPPQNPLCQKYEDIDSLYSTKRYSIPLSVPAEFRLLCAILGATPEKLLNDFMQNAGFTNQSSNAQHRIEAQEYLMECGYGKDLYTDEQLNSIFKELDAQRALWPAFNSMSRNQFNIHATWHHMYMEYWFKKWYWAARVEGDGEAELLQF
jgi:hypothetical protein